MKKLVLLCLAAFVIYSFDTKPVKKDPADNSTVTLAFVTYNGYGNNLFIDNLTAGKRDTLDLAVISINNPQRDTIYNNDNSGSLTLLPRVTIANVGKQNFGAFKVRMITNSNYADTAIVEGLSAGAVTEITFKSLTLITGVPTNMVAFISETAVDNKRGNDTLYQSTIVFPGLKRKVLLEEFTSNTCGSCAVNNPSLDDYINSKIDSIVAIKYHVGFPFPGSDSLYVSDSAQINQRIDYYEISAVPEVIIDGLNYVDQPYSGGSLDYPIAQRKLNGTPISISVADTRIGGDTISSTITLNIISPVRYANYKMRVNAIERKKTTAPAPNGETNFYDIFRHAFPDINGVSIPRNPGTYTYNYKYKREASWADSMMYTAVYIQDDNTNEVLNAGKSRSTVLDKSFKGLSNLIQTNNSKVNLTSKNICLSDKPLSTGKRRTIRGEETNQSKLLNSSYFFELFESQFPPAGWRLNNPNNDITFAPYSGANGILFGGSRSVFMNFFDYSTVGRRDTLVTKTFYGVSNSDSISFDYSHALYQNEIDSLIVLASVDGGITWPYRIFARGGTSLATTSATTNFFVPTNSSQWRTFYASLQNIVGITNISSEVPGGYELKQNYPNPFNPTTNISFSIPKASIVSIRIYDITGKQIDEIIKDNLQPGSYNYQWSGDKLSSGVYYYTLEAGEFKVSKKMVLVK